MIDRRRECISPCCQEASRRPLGHLLLHPVGSPWWVDFYLLSLRLVLSSKNEATRLRLATTERRSDQEFMHSHTAPSASRMTRILLVALSVAGRRAKQPTGAPNASHHGGKNSNCRRCVQNEGDISRWCGRITARDQPGTPDILVIFPLVSIHDSP